jgi:mitochondrial fission protein ELM1
MSTPLVWVLTDDKPGNRTQSLGVAAKLPWGFVEKKIHLNRLAKLPNCLVGRSLLTATTQSDALTPPWPDVAIAAGRRLVPALRFIKKKNPRCFITTIMRPDAPANAFDLLAIPEHDNPPARPNQIITLGAPHRVTPALLADAARDWQGKMAHLAHPRIAVLVGGNSASASFALEDFHELGILASRMALDAAGSLLVTTSRRTGKDASDYLRLALAADHELFLWEKDAPNPYHAFLGLADVIIVTGDSMSMCAEACSMGKPVFIYVPRKGNLAPKLRNLHERLFEQRLAQPLTANVSLDWMPAQPLDEAGRIAHEIVTRMGVLTI